MKNIVVLLSLLFAVLVAQLAWANKHSFAENSPTAVRPAEIDLGHSEGFETATFALG